MLFREADGHRYAVTQPTHAWVSGNLARAWGNSRFGDARPRDEVALGADLHDIGWLQWEQRPTLNADTGLPHNFMQLPTSVHLSIWGSASSLARPFGRYAALLVSMHGTGLYAFHDYSRDTEDEAASARAFVAREEAFQQRTIAELAADEAWAEAVSPETLARNRRLVAVWDAMSLAICGGVRATRTIRDVPAATGHVDIELRPLEGHVVVDPWPFARDEVRVRFEARQLDGTFTDEEEMHAALAAAQWRTFDILLVQG